MATAVEAWPAAVVEAWQTFDWPSPVGLSLGLLCVAVVQIVFVLPYHYMRKEYNYSRMEM